MVACVQVLLALCGMMVYHQEHTPSVSWQELQMARGKLKGGKFTLVGMGWKYPFSACYSKRSFTVFYIP